MNLGAEKWKLSTRKNSPGQRRWEQAIAQGKGGIFDDLTHQCAQQDGREDTTEQTNPCSVRQ